MRYTLTKVMIAAAALSSPYLCSAAPMQENTPLGGQAEEDCTNGLTAPPDVHICNNASLTATPMFDITGDQRMDLFVTVRDTDGNILRQVDVLVRYKQNRQSACTGHGRMK